MRFPRSSLVEFAKRAVQKGLLVGPEGNLSVRIKGQVFITPAGVPKEDLRPEEIAVVDLEGKLLEGKRPSSEIKMHLHLYTNQPEAKAIFHAHPSFTLALDLSGENFSQFYLPEALIYLRRIAKVPPLKPGSEELAANVAQKAKEAQVIILSRHGAVTFGKDLAEAFNLMLVLEKISRVTWLAKALKEDLVPLFNDFSS